MKVAQCGLGKVCEVGSNSTTRSSVPFGANLEPARGPQRKGLPGPRG